MIDNEERVILVSNTDIEIGEAPKLEVHRTGALHRAFSVFVFDNNGRCLLQRRAATKYHSPGLWSNTCCGHPRPGERTAKAARRRLNEEMGLDCDLTWVTSFVYQASLDMALMEHEFDHVYVGSTSSVPGHDSAEVGEWRWVSVDDIRDWLKTQPESFTAWFPPAFDHMLSAWRVAAEPGIVAAASA